MYEEIFRFIMVILGLAIFYCLFSNYWILLACLIILFIVLILNLASIINKEDSFYQTELFRNIDFGIFTKSFELVLLIEINDKTHMLAKRRKRDAKVKEILNSCHIPLLTFYTSYPNEKDYVVKRILKKIDEIKNKNN